MDQQQRFEDEKQRRSFLSIVVKIKLALCRLYTDYMDPVDITDHHRVMNRKYQLRCYYPTCYWI